MFEIETAAAFLLFSRHPADVLLLEVGLGGRLDATNVIDKPLACAITPVSMDHLEFLGDTIEKIAAEKAAILKRGVPAAIAPQAEVPLNVIERAAAQVRAPLRVCGQHWNVHEERGRLVYQDDDGLLDLPLPKLHGRHQLDNAGTAIATLRACGLALPMAAFEAGIAKAEWPARMQHLSQGALKQLVPAGSELWLDGGHNAEGGRAIASALGDLEERVSRPLIVVVGMLTTKDSAGFLRNFSGLARRVIAVPIPKPGEKRAGRDAGRHRPQRRHSGRKPRHAQVRVGRDGASGAGARAAHPDHRLALSRGRGAGAERHAAGVSPRQKKMAGTSPAIDCRYRCAITPRC